MSGKISICMTILIFLSLIFISCNSENKYERIMDKEFSDHFSKINNVLTASQIKDIIKISDDGEFIKTVYNSIQNHNVIFDRLHSQYNDDYNFFNILLRLMPLAYDDKFGNEIIKIFIEINKKNNYQYNTSLFVNMHSVFIRLFSSPKCSFDKKLLKELYLSFPDIKMLYLGSYGKIKSFKALYGDEIKFNYKKIYKDYLIIDVNNFSKVLKNNDILFFSITNDNDYNHFCKTLTEFLSYSYNNQDMKGH